MRRSLCWLVSLVLIFAVYAAAGDKSKDEETLANADTVLKAMLDGKSVPLDLLNKAQCVVVLPGVKKFGIGIGGSGGRGPMLCKTKAGTWSAPAMYTIGGVSAGLQVGGSSTDYILLVMTQKGVDAMLKGKSKLGNEMTAAAGPTGATSSHDIGSDVLSYGRAKGLFAGTSLGGASLEPDNDANKRLYGKEAPVEEIVIKNALPAPEAGKPLEETLNKATPKHQPAPKKK